MLAHDTLPLILLAVVIMLTGIATIFFVRETTHWMEGPAIAILVVFMPSTAISYLHFRLPKKKGEFKAIQKVLDSENTAAESFTVDIRQDDSSEDYLLATFFVSLYFAGWDSISYLQIMPRYCLTAWSGWRRAPL
jgi:hypothetical protein